MVTAGQVIRASDVKVQACRVTRTTSQSITDSTTTTVTFNDEVFDETGMHSTSVNTSRITIGVAGYYVVGFQGRFASGNDFVITQAHLLVNGTTTIALAQFPGTSNPVPQRVFVSTVDTFAVGDYIEAQVYQDNTANAARNLEVVSGQSPVFYAARIGS
jgi:hypothetical protein